MSISIVPQIINYFKQNSSFWIPWSVSLVSVIILAIFFKISQINKINQQVSVNCQNVKNSFNLQNNNKLLDYFLLIIFSLFICVYIYLILKDAEFAYHDNGQFTFFSLQGNFFGMPIWPDAGRYWPLGLQEYNLISLFSKTPLAYHSFSIIQLLITIFLCFSILSPINLILRIFILTIILTTSSFVISFYGLIFPERNLIFWLAVFIFCLIKQEKNQSLFYLCGVFISTQFLLYYKEPSFILILGFAITRLIIKFFNSPIWQQKKVKHILYFIKENWLEFGLLILSVVFIYLFVSNIMGKVETSYVDGREGVNIFSTLISYLKINPVLSIFIFFFGYRFINIFRKKQSIDLIWDSLAIGNLLYFLAYIKLNMFRWYYTAPVDFIAVLYLSKMIANLNIFVNTRSKYNYQKLIVFGLSALILLQNLHYSSYAILSRKNEINSRVAVANFLQDYLNQHQEKEKVNLFFPHLSGYYIQEFASFLNYKGFAILIDENYNINQQKQKKSDTYLIMQSNELFPDNLCVTFRPFQCFNINQPLKDDLIVFIPTSSMLFSPKLDEYVPTEELKNYEQNSVKIFHYQPDFKGIEYILYLFCQHLINEQWLSAYIFTDYHPDNL